MKTYCECGDPVKPGERYCTGCLLDIEERRRLREGKGPIIQVVDLNEGTIRHGWPNVHRDGLD